MTNQQVPEALRLADALYDGSYLLSVERYTTADELRRLHAENERLVALVDAQQPAPSAAAAPEGGPPGSGGWEKHAIEMERQRDYYRQEPPEEEEHSITFRRHEITLTKDAPDRNWYIVVRAPSGLMCYDGWWYESAGKTWCEALEEAKLGACMTREACERKPLQPVPRQTA